MSLTFCPLFRRKSIDPNYPLCSVLKALYYANSRCLFKEPLGSRLKYYIEHIFCGYFHPISFVNNFIENGLFKLTEYELFFDFHNYSPFFNFDESIYTFFENTIYTADFKRYKNKDGRTTGVKRSIMAYYNRALKLGFNASIKRLEFRICDIRARMILTPLDLVNSIDNFIAFHGNQIMNILKRYMLPHSIVYDKEYINANAPNLAHLLWFLE
jgi:hypothetical protein